MKPRQSNVKKGFDPPVDRSDDIRPRRRAPRASAMNNPAVRDVDDFYATHKWATDKIADRLSIGGHVLDPCAGTGSILRALEFWPRVKIAEGIELNEERAASYPTISQGDFFATEPRHVDWILTNPPYSKSLEFVRRALEWAPDFGTVMLLLLGWAASQKRNGLFTNHPIKASLFPLSKRPSFATDGKTAACDYAWFAWLTNRFDQGKFEVLPL